MATHPHQQGGKIAEEPSQKYNIPSKCLKQQGAAKGWLRCRRWLGQGRSRNSWRTSGTCFLLAIVLATPVPQRQDLSCWCNYQPCKEHVRIHAHLHAYLYTYTYMRINISRNNTTHIHIHIHVYKEMNTYIRLGSNP